MLKVFPNHYSKLQNILSAKQLSSCFVTERVINFEEEQIIQETVGQTQAASIVVRKITNSLQAGQTRSFDRLWKIMVAHLVLVRN